MSNCEHKFVLYSPHTIFSIQCIWIILVNKTLRILFVVMSSYAVRQRAVTQVQGSGVCPGIPAGSRQLAGAPGFSDGPSAAPVHTSHLYLPRTRARAEAGRAGAGRAGIAGAACKHLHYF